MALGGCGLFDDWFGTHKTPLPGKREAISTERGTLKVDEGAPKVELPTAVSNAAWPQAGGNPAHFMGHLAAGQRLGEAWSANIGAGGGYRRKIMAQPVVAEGIVYVMDSDAVVSAFDVAGGRRVWRFDTRRDEDDSSNVGGGLAIDQGTLYAVNGLAELVALDAAKGTVRWRSNFGAPTRSAPTVVEGRLFVTTIQDRMLALATDDGRQLWSHQATNPTTSLLGRPAPAYTDGLVVGGFGSGELATLHAESGTPVWTDTLTTSVGSRRDGGLLRGPWAARGG